MTSSTILHPLITLLVLNSVVLFWMYATRLPAIAKMGLKMDPNVPMADLMSQLPANVRWKADNYNHLLEQPTMFYAVVFTLVLLGAGDGLNTMLAWGYVSLRVVHTLVHALWNKIVVRFAVFFTGSLVLTAMVVRTVMLAWGG